MPYDTLATGSVDGAVALTAVLLFAGALLALAFHRLLRHRDSRRAWCREAPLCSRPTSFGLGVLTIAGFVLVAHSTCWQCFYALTFESDALILHYRLPQREVRLERDAILSTGAGSAGKSSQELRIETGNGVHTSGQVGRVQADAILARLQDWRRRKVPAEK